MNDLTPREDETLFTAAAAGWLLGATILAVGAVFFATTHSFSLAEKQDWSVSEDWAEEVEGGFSRTAKTVALPAVALWGLFLLIRKGRYPLRLDDWLTVAILAYAVACVLSVTWSTNPPLTIRRAVLAAVWCLAALGVAKQFSMRDVMLMALTIATGFLAVGVLAELAHGVFRPLAADYRFAGTVHPNAQGIGSALMCMSGVGMAASSPRHRKIYLLLAVLGLAALLLTKSRTSLASLLVAGGLVFLARRPLRSKSALFLFGIAVVCTVLLVAQFADFDPLEAAKQYVSLGREQEMESLTGRLPMWKELARYIQGRPWLGYGYRAFWDRQHTLDIGDALGGWQVPHAHSGYLDTALDFGVPAAIGFALAALWAAFRAGNVFRRGGGAAYGFAYALLIFALCDSLLESNFVIPNFVLFIAVCAAFHLALRAEGPATAPASSP